MLYKVLIVNLLCVLLLYLFCRWVEDKQVADRLLVIWPSIIQLYKFWDGLVKSKRPSSKSYLNLKTAVDDPLYTAKLSFFSYLAGILQPFLVQYQTDNPMLPFMYNDLTGLISKIMRIVIKSEIIDDCPVTNLKNIDLRKKPNILKGKDIDVGFAAKKIITDLKSQDAIDSTAITEFRNNVFNFVEKTVGKIFKRFPIGSVVVRTSRVFDPKVMVSESVDSLKSNIKTLLSHLLKLNILTTPVCDNVLSEYSDVLSNELHILNDEFRSFDRQKQRLDSFYFSILKAQKYKNLSVVLRIIFTLSHGQASVERGFSVNKSILGVNMKEQSIVARKIIRDHMLANNLVPHTIEITNKMIVMFKAARQMYNVYKEEMAATSLKEIVTNQNKIIDSEIASTKSRCVELQNTCALLQSCS